MTTTSEKTAGILKAQFILGVADGERSAAYYRDVLGFTLVQRPSGTGDGWYVVERTGFRIWLGETTGPFTPASECRDHSWFAYAVVDDIDALYNEVKGKGATLWHDIETKGWGMREFAVETIDGHRIVFGAEVG